MAGSNNFSDNIIATGTGTDATSPQIGFGRDATTNATTGPRIINITADPNGTVTAPKGSIGIGAVGGSGAAYINTDGAKTWKAITHA